MSKTFRTGLKRLRSKETVRALALLIMWHLPVGAVAQTPQELASAASMAMQKQEYEKAEGDYKKLVELFPEAAELRSNLGLAYYFQRKLRAAEETFQEALDRDPRLFVPNLFLGRIYLEYSRPEDALPFLESALMLDQQGSTARPLLAACLVGLGRHGEALIHYRDILNSNGKDIETLYAVSRVYMHLGQKSYDRLGRYKDSGFRFLVDAEFNAERPRWHELAERDYRRAIAASLQTPGLRNRLGMFLLRIGKIDAALQSFQEELAVDAQSYEAHFGLAAVYLHQGNSSLAAEHANKAVNIRPEFFQPLLLLPGPVQSRELTVDLAPLQRKAQDGDFGASYLLAVLTARDDGQLADPWRSLAERANDRITQDLRSATAAAPASRTAELAMELLRQKRYEPAIDMLLRPSPAPNDSETQTALVRALYGARRFGDLAQLLERADTDNPELVYLLGASYKALAQETLERIMAVDDDSPRAHQLLGDSYYAREAPQEALKHYSAALQGRPNDSELTYSLGRAYLLLPDCEKAIPAFDRTLKLNSLHAEAAYLKGDCLESLGRADDAVFILGSALRTKPGLTAAHISLGKSLAKLGRTQEAVKHLELGAGADQDGTAHYLLFTLYRKLGNDEKAALARKRSQELRDLAASRDEPR